MKEHLYSDRYSFWKDLFPLQWGNRRNRLRDSSSEESNEDYPEPDSSEEDRYS